MKLETEKNIEKYLVTKSKKLGILCYKLLSTTNGLPDRLLIKNEKVLFVEIKGTNGKLSMIQERTRLQFKREGIIYHVIKSKEEVDILLDSLVY